MLCSIYVLIFISGPQCKLLHCLPVIMQANKVIIIIIIIIIIIRIKRDFFKHRTVKTNDKNQRFGVVITPLSRKKYIR